jgi:hypothetical protein
MKSTSRLCFCLLLSLCTVVPRTAAQKNDSANFSATDTAEAANVEAQTVGGEVEEVRPVLPSSEGAPRGFAFVILRKHEWRVAFVRAEKGRFRLGWLSAPLPMPFEGVAVGESLSIVSFGPEQMAEFRGCANHMCPYAFGIALFRLSDGKEFVMKVIRIKDNEIEYSPDLLLPENKKYKDWLDNQIKEGPILDPHAKSGDQ